MSTSQTVASSSSDIDTYETGESGESQVSHHSSKITIKKKQSLYNLNKKIEHQNQINKSHKKQFDEAILALQEKIKNTDHHITDQQSFKWYLIILHDLVLISLNLIFCILIIHYYQYKLKTISDFAKKQSSNKDRGHINEK